MNRRLTISQWVYWLERDSILIAYYNQDTHKYSSPTEAKTVTLYYIQRPDKFLLQGESPERAGFAELACLFEFIFSVVKLRLLN